MFLTLLAVAGIAIGAWLWAREWRTPPDDTDPKMVHHIRVNYPDDDGAP